MDLRLLIMSKQQFPEFWAFQRHFKLESKKSLVEDDDGSSSFGQTADNTPKIRSQVNQKHSQPFIYLVNLFDVFELIGLVVDVSGPSRYDTESGNKQPDSIKILLAVWQVWHNKVQRNIYGDLDEMETACQCLIKRDRTIAWMQTAHDIMTDWNSNAKIEIATKMVDMYWRARNRIMIWISISLIVKISTLLYHSSVLSRCNSTLKIF